jgi:hypothetical protein
MEQIAIELSRIAEQYAQKIEALPELELMKRPHPTKWSKKEVIGHLIDSAQNNLRRFVCGQYESIPPKITYNQDFWVIANGYHRIATKDIVTLWKLTNERIADVLSNMPMENYNCEVNTGSHVPELHTLAWLAEDYVKHLKHHLNQVIPGSFDTTYP